jgi:hypothetical protein
MMNVAKRDASIPASSIVLKKFRFFLQILTILLLPKMAQALVVGPYSPDGNTLHLTNRRRR